MEVGNVSLVPAGAGLPVLAETRLVSNGMPVGRPDIQGRRLVYDQGVWNGNSATGPYQVYSMDMDSGSTTLLSSGLTASQWMPRLYGPNTIWLDWGGKRVMRHNPGEVPPISTVAGYVEPAATAAIYGGYVAYLSTANGARKVRLRDLSTDQDVVVDGANPGYIEDAPSLADGLIAFQQRASESAPSHVRLFSFSVAGGILSTRPVFNSGTLYPSSHQVKPQLSGRVGDWTLVWLDYVANDAADLYGYRQSVGRFPIMVGQGALENPALQGDLAVWQKPKEGGLYDLYGYSISRGQLFPVATGPGSRSNPRVDGDRVVWMDTRSGKPEIYMASVQWVEATSTPAPTPSPTATPLTTATATATSTPYFTSTPSSTPSATPTAIPTDTPSPTASPTSTPLPTDTPSPTASPTFTPLPTNTPSPAPTSTPTGTPTHVPTATSTPTAALGPATAGRYGDDDPRVRYGEGWSVWVGEGPEGGSDHRSELVGSSLWFSFVGSTVALISAVGPDEGIAEVLIDGVFQPEAILHADSPRWQQAITYQVSPGEHTLLVMVSSSAWMGSPSHRVSIDGFLVDQSPTPTTSPVATATPTETLTPIPTATRTVTSTPTSTATSTPTPTSPATLTPTSTPTSTATPTSVPTSTPTVAPSLSPTPNPAATPTGTSSPLSLGFIDGTVRLQARADASGVRVTARLGDQAVQTTPSAAGSYSLRVAPGTYQVRASHRGYLTAIRDGVSVTAGKTATMAPLTLMSGELSEEMSSAGVVDAADLAFVERYYGQRPAAELVGEAADADINRDGVVDLYDLVAVTSNWLKLGSDYGW